MFKHMNKKWTLGVDIGGSHIAAALVNTEDGQLIPGTFYSEKIDPRERGSRIIDRWTGVIQTAIAGHAGALSGVGIAMPGPFDYSRGISLIDGVGKYQDLYGINILAALKNRLAAGGIERTALADMPILFENDAAAFGLGESFSKMGKPYARLIAITLGTGFGSAFIAGGQVIKEGAGVPPGGMLYNSPYKESITEDYISARWLLNSYNDGSADKAGDVKELAQRAQSGDALAQSLFAEFGTAIAECLAPWLSSFEAEALVIGGSISQASPLFLPAFSSALDKLHVQCPVLLSENTALSAIAGAARLIQPGSCQKGSGGWRKTSQALMPLEAPLLNASPGDYDLYPFRRLGDGLISRGYDSLAAWMSSFKSLVIDGYVGNDWAAIREQLSACFDAKNIRVIWYESSAFFKPEVEIDALIAPWLGERGGVWGRRTELVLADLFLAEKLKAGSSLEQDAGLSIFIGPGAALCQPFAPVVYVDLPKNELQYRMRAGACTCLGQRSPDLPAEMYKRFYFVDWVLLNQYRQDIKSRIALVADGQWKEDLSWMPVTALQEGLDQATRHLLRVRPWFEAGVWGGQWLKQHIPQLPQQEINYAWSFELIVPENGLVFESDGHLLEVSFDWIMEHDAAAILGKDAARFGTEFPIRFDFLDTFDGGNLSIQCHPRLDYIRENFGERITQDETYYILDCRDDASVYLGFQESIEPVTFRATLENSVTNNIPVDIEKYVQRHAAQRHDLFLIPNGTVHSAGANNLVLEISATPYIFTFKMYDWLRLDLNGEPRPINLEHAFNNLDFDRKGGRVEKELIAHPVVIDQEKDYRLVHLPTHPEHFYDVHRIEFSKEVMVSTEGKCHVLMLVEGRSILVITQGGERHRCNYAETFVIPAAAEGYLLINEDGTPVKVIKAFIK
jgi:predicted NBD/HSP70 family sugar kinase/mannose-6-phosphate isomerase class I